MPKIEQAPFPFYEKREFPLFGKWFDETHHPELVQGEGLLACAEPRLPKPCAASRRSGEAGGEITEYVFA